VKVYNYTAVIEYDEEAKQYIGTVPALPSAHTYGETLEQLNAHLHELVELILEEMEEQGREVPDIVGTQRVTVSVGTPQATVST
jgi:predicted RNase H-like HicB family nuclease